MSKWSDGGGDVHERTDVPSTYIRVGSNIISLIMTLIIRMNN